MIFYPDGFPLYGNYHMLDVNVVVWVVEHTVYHIRQQYFCFVYILYIMNQMVSTIGYRVENLCMLNVYDQYFRRIVFR